ncbi:MAG: hypothetical protein ACLQF2_15450, partial [Rhodomicrobium sp.]
ILSFSPWERGRLNKAQRSQHRPLSHGERDRVRGGALGHGGMSWARRREGRASMTASFAG